MSALQWARAKCCDWDADTCDATLAAGGGHLEMLQWLRAICCDWDSGACVAAAGGGHLEVLQGARTNGCDWDEDTCKAAAGAGHLVLEVLQWARANDSVPKPPDRFFLIWGLHSTR